MAFALILLGMTMACSSASKSMAADPASPKSAPTAPATTAAPAQIVEVERTNPFTGKFEKVNVEVQTIECKKGNSLRAIYIEHKNKDKIPNGAPICFVKYKKEGLMKVVARANYERKRCQEVANNLEKNLENSGYICQGN